jgi:hypothetical protein
MELFSIIVSSIIVILLIVLLITIIKYPKDILIDLPAGILKIGTQQFLFYLKLFTLPVWLPVWIVDNYYKLGIFNHPVFKFFNSNSDIDDIPDIEYKCIEKLKLDFINFSKYFISSMNDKNELLSSLYEGLESIGKKELEFNILQVGKMLIAQNDKITLYDFHYLIQWLDTENNRFRNFGFAKNSNFSFFAHTDKLTLNNVIGKTSDKKIFAFNLVNGQEDYLAISKEIYFNSKINTEFFDELIKNCR